MKIFLLIILFFLSGNAISCSKILPGLDQLDEYQTIVYGKVIAVKDNLNLSKNEISMVSNMDVTVEVRKTYIGLPSNKILVKIEECSTQAPRIGDRGLFFINSNGPNRSVFKYEKGFYKEMKSIVKAKFG